MVISAQSEQDAFGAAVVKSGDDVAHHAGSLLDAAVCGQPIPRCSQTLLGGDAKVDVPPFAMVATLRVSAPERHAVTQYRVRTDLAA